MDKDQVSATIPKKYQDFGCYVDVPEGTIMPTIWLACVDQPALQTRKICRITNQSSSQIIKPHTSQIYPAFWDLSQI
jgi:hypothetical protein